MLTSIDIFVTSSRTDTFQIGVDGVTNIQVMSFFANCVHVKIFFAPNVVEEYFQMPCLIHYS